jgi:hypothetical protein
MHPSRILKAIKILLLSLGGIYVGYLVAVSIFLIPSVFARIVGFGSDFGVSWKRASSYWPGRVVLHDVRVQGQDSNVRWHVDVAEVRTQVSLTALLDKRFHAEPLRAREARFELKFRDEAERARLNAEGQAWKKGLNAAQVRERHERNIEEARRGHWRVELENVVIDSLPSLQVQALRVLGTERVTGRLNLWPGVEAEIGPGTLVAPLAKLQVHDQDMLTPVAVSAAVTIGRFVPEFDTGSRAMKHLSLDLRAQSQAIRLSAIGVELKQYFPQLALAPESAASHGSFDLHFRVVNDDAAGALLRVRANLPDVRGKWRKQPFAGRADLSADVRPSGESALELAWKGQAWSGGFHLQHARFGMEDEFFVDPSRKFSLEGAISLEMTGAAPVISLLGGRDVAPLWAIEALEKGPVRGRAILFSRRGSAGLYAIDAQAGTIGVTGRLSRDEGGRLILKAGLLAVGVELFEDEDPHLKLFPGKHWLDRPAGAPGLAGQAGPS